MTHCSIHTPVKMLVALAAFYVSTLLFSTSAFAFTSLTPADIKKARAGAKNGDVESQLILAEAYGDGAGGLKKSDAEAVKWFTKAAEQGNLEGEYNLGIAYYRGMGVKKNMTKAIHWFQKAADQGYAEAEYILSAAYLNGRGDLPKDKIMADVWLGMAEKHGKREAISERISLESNMTDQEVEKAKQLIDERGKQ